MDEWPDQSDCDRPYQYIAHQFRRKAFLALDVGGALRGCEVLEGPEAAQPHDSCTMCGRPVGAASSSSKSPSNKPPSSLATTRERIHAVDDYVARSLETDSSARDRVMKDPTEAFAQASQTLFGARPEELFGIHAVQLAADTDTMLYAIRLADHAPKRTVTSRAAAPAEAVAAG